jgi:transcriptional regulator with XRE-family HTH domain
MAVYVVDRKAVKERAIKQISARVREARKQAGLSQERLARRADMSREGIRRIDQGLTLPDLTTLEVLAYALGVPVVELLPPDYASIRDTLE